MIPSKEVCPTFPGKNCPTQKKILQILVRFITPFLTYLAAQVEVATEPEKKPAKEKKAVAVPA
jgi:hypothetical protein